VAEDADNGYWIVAARSGTVVQLDAQPGQEVGPNREHPVVTVADLDEVLVLADVPQRDTPGLRHGLTVRVAIPGRDGAPLAGALETVSEVVDPERQTVPVRIHVANRERLLRPNAFVEATFAVDERHQVLQVPTESVVTDGLQSVVFVEGEPGAFHRRAVTLGRHSSERTEILSGLKPGERVVTRGALLLLNAIDLEG
jgi:cobalt-zinc-cadmium efflux system membrane fusion protein